jgi:hypothetical protein
MKRQPNPKRLLAALLQFVAKEGVRSGALSRDEVYRIVAQVSGYWKLTGVLRSTEV